MRQLWAETSGGLVSEAPAWRRPGLRRAPARLGAHHGRAAAARVAGRPLALSSGATKAALMLAQRLGLRLREASGVQVTHVLAGSAAQQAALGAGRDPASTHRVRRLDEAFWWIAPTGTLQVLVCRDQRLLTLPSCCRGGPRRFALALASGCEGRSAATSSGLAEGLETRRTRRRRSSWCWRCCWPTWACGRRLAPAGRLGGTSRHHHACRPPLCELQPVLPAASPAPRDPFRPRQRRRRTAALAPELPASSPPPLPREALAKVAEPAVSVQAVTEPIAAL